MQRDEQHDAVLTPAEAGRRLGVSADTVLAWIRRGELPAANLSITRASQRPRYRVRLADLLQFYDSRTVHVETKLPRRKSGAARESWVTDYVSRWRQKS